MMDAATVLGACGIAYALRFIRANIQGGIEIGFDAATATLIASQTVKGAAELLIQTGSVQVPECLLLQKTSLTMQVEQELILSSTMRTSLEKLGLLIVLQLLV